MNRFIFNSKVIALPNKNNSDIVTVHVDPLVTFATKYGLFFPNSSSGYMFLRWIQKGMPRLGIGGEVNMVTDLVHVDNFGDVHILSIDGNVIKTIPYTGDLITYFSADRELNEAYTYLFAKRKYNVSEAISLLANETKLGFYQPHIITVEEWVKHAEENDLTELFFRNRINCSANRTA